MRTLALVLVTACGTTSLEPVQGPRAVRTSDHLEAAREHDKIAHSHTPAVTDEVTPGVPTTTTPAMPFFIKWDPGSDHARIARIHRSEAAANRAEYGDACGERDVKKVVGSPLSRHRVGGWNTGNGVVVVLSTLAGPEQQLMTDLRCYRAWLIVGSGVEQDSPLALPGLLADVRGDQDGITLTLTTRDARLIPELQRRVLRQLEESRRPARHED